MSFAAVVTLKLRLVAMALLPIVGDMRLPPEPLPPPERIPPGPEPEPPEELTIALGPAPLELPPGGTNPSEFSGVTGLENWESGPVPAAFIAATLNVYAVPFVRPTIVSAVDGVSKICGVCGAFPTYGVIMYAVMGDPPSLAGVFHTTVALEFPGDATTLVGAPGTVDGMTGLDGSDSRPTPAPLIAATLKV